LKIAQACSLVGQAASTEQYVGVEWTQDAVMRADESGTLHQCGADAIKMLYIFRRWPWLQQSAAVQSAACWKRGDVGWVKKHQRMIGCLRELIVTALN